MEESAKNSRHGIWWEYIKSEKHVFLVFLAHTLISAGFIVLLWLLYNHIDFPDITLKELSKKIAKYLAIPISTIIIFIINCFFRMCNSRYDVSFMSLMEQKRQSGIVFLVGAILFGVVFFLTLATNLVNVIKSINPDVHVRMTIMLIQLVIFLFVLGYNVIKKKANGREDIITFLEAMYILALLVCYPITEGSLVCVLIYWVFIITMSFSIMYFLDTLIIWDTALYYFEKDDNKMYIHYRLDDDRVVCSKDAVLRLDSNRILYEIADLCEQNIRKDTNNSNKNWDEAILKLKELEGFKNSRNKITITKRISNFFVAIRTKIGSTIIINIEKLQKKIRRFIEKQDKINKLKAKAKENNRKAKKWEDEYKALHRENKKLLAEIEELKRRSEGA